MEFEQLGMANDVIEFDMMELGDDTVDIEHQLDDDDSRLIENSYGSGGGGGTIGEIYIPEGDTNLEPYEGMEFESEEAAKAFYNSYNTLRREALKFVDEGVNTAEIYNVAMGALREAASKVAVVKSKGGRMTSEKETSRKDHLSPKTHADVTTGLLQLGSEGPQSEDEQEKKIQKLTRQLERSQRKCEVYRANLLALLKDIEQQKLELTVKVQSIKLGMKD
ncbi:hypothetical protein Vadar_004328 [Vaccinium darrowii]|uniref:Uncharacterized protein n=1 Tax=Vaccinium darrowii TaxID=229202 RepID=A0ACB7Y6G3_9ERIC|nr:hypothetical protein Vadar_004328 [Vaccinium darrowii]